MKSLNTVATGIGQIPTNFVVDSVMALGLDHAVFTIVNVCGVTALMIDESQVVDEHKMFMLRSVLNNYQS